MNNVVEDLRLGAGFSSGCSLVTVASFPAPYGNVVLVALALSCRLVAVRIQSTTDAGVVIIRALLADFLD
jgi:hypothetical protein